MKSFIQIGAGAGDLDARAGYRDGFSEFVKNQDKSSIGRIILVEPNPVNIPNLTECWKDYPQAEIHNIGICLDSSSERTITFYYADKDAPHYQVFSMIKEHVIKHYPSEEIKSTAVPCKTLKEFLDSTVGTDFIDMLALDIEGIDAEIILTNDWKNINCRQLSFEHFHLGNKINDVQSTLEQAGYKFVGSGLDYTNLDWLYEKEKQ